VSAPSTSRGGDDHPPASINERGTAASPAEVERLLHELQVHQIELLSQNEELRQVQHELEVSRAKYFDLYDLAPVGYVALDEQGMIIQANLTAATLLGLSRDALVGRPLAVFVRPDDRDALYLALKALEKTGTRQQCELGVERADQGVPLWARLDMTLADEDTAGESPVRVTISDITERRQAETERVRLSEQLAQSRKVEAIGRLAGGIAHDSNNMLGVILGHVELALTEVDPAVPLHADLLEIQRAARRSADLTRQLLAFARQQPAAPVVLNVDAAVGGMVTMLRRLIGEDITLEWVPGGVNDVAIDPSQVDQILTNLCVNARDAIDGVGTVVIATRDVEFDEVWCANVPDSAPGRYLVLSVGDDGCGMSQDVLEHVFEPFYTTKDRGMGTGLGLATVYGIVRQNGGFVDVASRQGRGTSINVYLPQRESPPVSQAVVQPSRSIDTGRETVLLVEDEPALLRLGLRMLGDLGYTVLCAATPGEALRLAEDGIAEIDLLITDVIMPKMNGVELAQRLRSLVPDIALMFMSGYPADIIARQGALEEGVVFLEKPFTREQLAQRVREALDEHARP
jgi:two-component system cell cycle sensor histidine kinase/response regulator CckA